MRLHLFNMTEFDAVMYVDMDVEIFNNPLPLFQCASRGAFLMTAGIMLMFTDTPPPPPVVLAVAIFHQHIFPPSPTEPAGFGKMFGVFPDRRVF